MIQTLVIATNARLLGGIERVLVRDYADLLGPIFTARSHADALNHTQAMEPSLILLDLGIPGMAGLDLIPRLRVVCPDTIIVVMIGLKIPGYRVAAFNGGADSVIYADALQTELRTVLYQAGF